MPMKPRQEKGGYFPYFTGVLVIAGIVHVASVLAIPRLAPKDAFARIATLARLNEITLLRFKKVATDKPLENRAAP